MFWRACCTKTKNGSRCFFPSQLDLLGGLQAALQGRTPVVAALLAAGGNLFARGVGGWSALHYAAHNAKDPNGAKARGANADGANEAEDATTTTGGSAWVQTLEALLSPPRTARTTPHLLDPEALFVNARDDGGRTALMVAAGVGATSAVKLGCTFLFSFFFHCARMR